MKLREYLDKYKALTLELMDAVQKDLEVDSLIEKREEILNSINSLDFDKQEINEIVNSLNILGLEEELQNLIKKEKVKVKKQIETLKKARQANNNYNNFENKARVFNKSI